MIRAAAVEAAARQLASHEANYDAWPDHYRAKARSALEAAAPHMQGDAELMRWKLDALKEWSDAMINESNSPQYGRDVRTLLEVASMDEAGWVDAL